MIIYAQNFSIVSQCTASRLTETARLLKNVKSVFTRRANAATRVNVEVELSRKLLYALYLLTLQWILPKNDIQQENGILKPEDIEISFSIETVLTITLTNVNQLQLSFIKKMLKILF